MCEPDICPLSPLDRRDGQIPSFKGLTRKNSLAKELGGIFRGFGHIFEGLAFRACRSR